MKTDQLSCFCFHSFSFFFPLLLLPSRPNSFSFNRDGTTKFFQIFSTNTVVCPSNKLYSFTSITIKTTNKEENYTINHLQKKNGKKKINKRKYWIEIRNIICIKHIHIQKKTHSAQRSVLKLESKFLWRCREMANRRRPKKRVRITVKKKRVERNRIQIKSAEHLGKKEKKKLKKTEERKENIKN